MNAEKKNKKKEIDIKKVEIPLVMDLAHKMQFITHALLGSKLDVHLVTRATARTTKGASLYAKCFFLAVYLSFHQ